MQTKRFYRYINVFSLFVFFQFLFVFGVNAQGYSKQKLDLSVAGIELGNRESAEKFLKDGYAPRLLPEGRVGYYFYNKWANQVMRLSAPSMADKYFITEIEVFSVSKSYRQPHFHAEAIKYFETENGVFIGFKQSALFMIVGIKNAGSTNEFKPKHIIKLLGEPTERSKSEKRRETIKYKVSDVEVSGQDSTKNYVAKYEFYKNKLNRFSVKLVTKKTSLAKK